MGKISFDGGQTYIESMSEEEIKEFEESLKK